MNDITVKVSLGGEVREVTRTRIPRVGSWVKIDGRRWLVIATQTPVKHRVSFKAFTA